MTDIIAWIFNSFLFGTVLPFLVVLSVIVFVHEMGHFLVGRWCGVKVEVFSIGFGRELFGRTDRLGTHWKFCVIPLGGYVKFYGDENSASVPDHDKVAQMSAHERAISFPTQPLYKRAAIVAAGPLANFVFSVFVFAGLFMLFGQQYLVARVGEVKDNLPAQQAGFLVGDRVLAINDETVNDFLDMARIVSISADEELAFRIERDGRVQTLNVTPVLTMTDIGKTKFERGIIGIGPSKDPKDRYHVRVGPLDAFVLGATNTGRIISDSLRIVGKIFYKPAVIKQMSGPLGIAQVSSLMAERGIYALVSLIAWVSVGIGLINLFPIPMLDGGHLLFYFFEAVRGKPLSEKTQEWGFGIGVTFILMLLAVTTWSDSIRILASW